MHIKSLNEDSLEIVFFVLLKFELSNIKNVHLIDSIYV
jgi:hypothetical protein